MIAVGFAARALVVVGRVLGDGLGGWIAPDRLAGLAWTGGILAPVAGFGRHVLALPGANLRASPPPTASPMRRASPGVGTIAGRRVSALVARRAHAP